MPHTESSNDIIEVSFSFKTSASIIITSNGDSSAELLFTSLPKS